jgi:hypothetical protein
LLVLEVVERLLWIHEAQGHHLLVHFNVTVLSKWSEEADA